MNKQTERYDELAGVLSALGPDIDEDEVVDSIHAALNCKRENKLHILAVIVSLHCGFESDEPCEPCQQGRERIKDAILDVEPRAISRDFVWPETIED